MAWIKCSDQMPETGKWVAVVQWNRHCLHKGEAILAVAKLLEGDDPVLWKQQDMTVCILGAEVTHWMPLPPRQKGTL